MERIIVYWNTGDPGGHVAYRRQQLTLDSMARSDYTLPVDNTAVDSEFTGTHIPRMDRFLFWIYYPSSPCIL